MHSTPENPPPGDNECQKTPAALRIVFGFGFLKHADELITEIECVAEILERARMFAHAWDLRMIEPGSQGDHEMIVAEGERCRSNARAQHDRARAEIDRLDIARVDTCSWSHPPDWGDNMVELDGTRNHFRQQRLENDVVLPIHQSNLSLLQFTR